MRLDLVRTPEPGDLAVRGDELGGARRVVVLVDEDLPTRWTVMRQGGGVVTGAAIDREVPPGDYRATVWSVEPPLAPAAAALILMPLAALVVTFVLIIGGEVSAADVWAKGKWAGVGYLVLAAIVVAVRAIAATRLPHAAIELRTPE